MPDSLEYDGQKLKWLPGGKTYKATSGLPGSQVTTEQCVRDAGPIPEGKYYLQVRLDPKTYASDDGTKLTSGVSRCNLRAAGPIQQIPRGGDTSLGPKGSEAGYCEPYWANWGWRRVRLEAADIKTAKACAPARSGFYLHDSTKGFSHGCIEVEGSFFDALIALAKTGKQKRMLLVVSYKTSSTYGGTKVPAGASSP